MTPDVEAYTAISEQDADGAKVRSILDVLPTEDLIRAEWKATRLIWAARELRLDREKARRG